MEKLFKLAANKTNVKTEIIAGVTTFFTMAYIIFVNPMILKDAGMDEVSVMVATCIASALGTLLTAFLSNYPFAQAPGMGLNAFFAYTICGALGFSWQAALAAVFVSGIIFIIITVTRLRTAIVNAIPMHLKRAISAGIGMFIALIGMSNAGLLAKPESSVIIGLGDWGSPSVLLSIFGLFLITVLLVRKVKGALFIGIVGTSVVGVILQFAFHVDVGVRAPDFSSFSFRLDGFGQFAGGFQELFSFSEGIGVGIMSLVTVLLSLTMVDMFDTIGTLIGTAEKAGFLDREGKLERADGALLADAIATTTGAVLGTSTVTTYVESAAGVSEGGRTGLTSATTGVLFLLSLVLAPVLNLVPGAATAPALIIVGVMMVSALKGIDWHSFEEALPAFMVVVMMPFAYSIADGIGLGFIFYSLVKLCSGKAREVSPILYSIALLFVVRFIFMVIG